MCLFLMFDELSFSFTLYSELPKFINRVQFSRVHTSLTCNHNWYKAACSCVYIFSAFLRRDATRNFSFLSFSICIFCYLYVDRVLQFGHVQRPKIVSQKENSEIAFCERRKNSNRQTPPLPCITMKRFFSADLYGRYVSFLLPSLSLFLALYLSTLFIIGTHVSVIV